jgi:hypothetical protein
LRTLEWNYEYEHGCPTFCLLLAGRILLLRLEAMPTFFVKKTERQSRVDLYIVAP